MRTYIVSPDIIGPIKNGGIGTFATTFARLLRRHGHEVEVLFTNPIAAAAATTRWQADYEREGIPVRPILERDGWRDHVEHGHYWFIRRSEAVAHYLADHAQAQGGVVYFQDWQANGFTLMRQRRLGARSGGASRGRALHCVTVLHGCSAWIREGMQRFPTDVHESPALDFAERYAAEHSDAVVSPSRYMLDWAAAHGWRLPNERRHVLGLPHEADPPSHALPSHAPHFRRVCFFGRLETRKGLDVFVGALQLLHAEFARGRFPQLREVIFLGKPGEHQYQTLPEIAHALSGLPLAVHFEVDLDSRAAQRYLADHAADTLVVMPSLSDNFPYSVIEASRLPGLNFMCANVGGIPEILGTARQGDLFAPTPRSLAEGLCDRLDRGPQPTPDAGYEVAAANARWLAFHEQMLANAREREPHLIAAMPITAAPITAPAHPPRLDVCIPYYNHGPYLGALLRSLEAQTETAFSVTVVDDGSPDPASTQAFHDLKAAYAPRGWQFVTKPNAGVSHTRNLAAALGSAEYVCFVDADNLAAPTMIARMIEGMDASGADCLTCYLYAFEGDPPLEALVTGKHPALYTYHPLGGLAEAGLLYNCFGDTNFVIRRATFERLGGFPTYAPGNLTNLTNEDYELLARLVLGGGHLDVIPEFLFFYRHLPGSNHRRANQYLSERRVLEVYAQRLAQVGLGALAEQVHTLYNHDLEHPNGVSIYNLHDPRWVAQRVPWWVIRDAVVHKVRKHLRRLPLPTALQDWLSKPAR